MRTAVRKLGIHWAILGVFLLAPVQSGAVVLDFEGLDGNIADRESIDGFYGGGTGSKGNSGTDYGITFSNATAIDSVTSSFANLPSEVNALFVEAIPVVMNVTSGFTALSGFYAAPIQNLTYTVEVYAAADGAGTLLGSLALAPTMDFDDWQPLNVAFAGTAFSATISSSGPQFAAFDDLRVELVPEPSTSLLLGTGLAWLALRRRPARAARLGAAPSRSALP